MIRYVGIWYNLQSPAYPVDLWSAKIWSLTSLLTKPTTIGYNGPYSYDPLLIFPLEFKDPLEGSFSFQPMIDHYTENVVNFI